MPRERAKKKLLFADQRADFLDVTTRKRRKTATVYNNGTAAADQNEGVQAGIEKLELPGLEEQLGIIDEVIGWGFTNPEHETQRKALDAEHNMLALFGPPATGKTAILAYLRELVPDLLDFS